MGGDWGRRAVRRRLGLLLDNNAMRKIPWVIIFLYSQDFGHPGATLLFVLCVLVSISLYYFFFFFAMSRVRFEGRRSAHHHHGATPRERSVGGAL